MLVLLLARYSMPKKNISNFYNLFWMENLLLLEAFCFLFQILFSGLQKYSPDLAFNTQYNFLPLLPLLFSHVFAELPLSTVFQNCVLVRIFISSDNILISLDPAGKGRPSYVNSTLILFVCKSKIIVHRFPLSFKLKRIWVEGGDLSGAVNFSLEVN